jgi:arginine/ornithine transport system substrate-binding protein
MKKLIASLLVTSLALMSGQINAKEWKEVKVGVEGAYPPFSFVDTNGKLQGFDIDITYALCDAMKVKCKLVQQDFDGLIPALLAKKIDAIIASMSITEERKQKVAFTKKYYQTPARFVRKKGSGIEITKEGLKDKTVGVQQATIHDTYLTDNYGDVVKIKRYSTLDEAYLDLATGRLDLLLADSIPVKDGFLNKPAGKDFEFVGPSLTDPRWFGEGIGIAVRKGDSDLREMLNKAIDTIRADGIYKKIAAKYFDFDIYGD